MATLPASKPNRDSVTTIGDDGSRRFLYPADSHGRFIVARRLVSLTLVVFYLLAPWVKINGYPAIFLDVAHRRFHLFGATLAAQDMWLLFFLISGVGFTLYYVTSLFGRIWCGWACPQTVFLDHVFRVIERAIEGDAVKRRQLEKAPWTNEKIVKRVAKHALYLLAAAGITHLFLAYFVSIPELWTMMSSNPGANWASFVGVMVATGVLYFNFAWFRDQLCIIICPYGRLQSALIDDNTMVIGYDAQRGEPRGRVSAASAGACVDCSRCVQVCPTGIDIRQGLQIECIGCAACIDACDEVMDRLGRPRGLVRYDSLNGLQGKRTRFIRPRTIAYSVLLLIGVVVASLSIASVKPANLGVTRLAGAPYFRDEHSIRNQFLVRVVNKSDVPVQLHLSVKGVPSTAILAGLEDAMLIGPMGEELRPVVVQLPLADYRGKFEFSIELSDTNHTYTLAREVDFSGPDPKMLQMTGGAHGP